MSGVLRDGTLFKLPQAINIVDPVNKSQRMEYKIDEIMFLQYFGEYKEARVKIMLRIQGTTNVLLVDYGLGTHAHFEENMWYDFPTSYDVYNVPYMGATWTVLYSLVKLYEVELDRGGDYNRKQAVNKAELNKLNSDYRLNSKYFFFINCMCKPSCIWKEDIFEMPINCTVSHICRFIDRVNPNK